MPNQREINVMARYGCGQCAHQIIDFDMARMLGVEIGWCEWLEQKCSFGGNSVECHKNGGPGVFNDGCGRVDPRSPFRFLEQT